MKVALKKIGTGSFKRPPGIVEVRVNKKTGELASLNDLNSHSEIFVFGTEPGGSIQTQKDNIEDAIIEDNDFFQE